jgi:oligosaccharide repeat unit polymerase
MSARALRACWLLALLAVILLVPRELGPIGAGCVWAACMLALVRCCAHGVLSLPSLYLLMLGVFHLGLVVPMALGASPAELPEWVGSPHLPSAVALVSVACVAFTLGATARAPAPHEERSSVLPPQRQLFQIGMLVAAIGAGFLWIGVSQLGILSSGYGEYFERALVEDVRLFGFGIMLFPIAVLVASAGATPRQMFVPAAMTVVVLGPIFLSGFRGPTTVLAMALLAVWAHKQRRVARWLAVGVLAAAIVLVPVIRLTRDDRRSIGVPTSFDPLAGFMEAGGSLYPLVITVEMLESGAERPWMGRSWAMAVGRVLPNVGSRVVRGDASRAPPGWATLHADPWAFENGYGIGFSGVAEPYLNFGTTGVVVFFVLLGWILRACDGWLATHPFRAAIAAAAFNRVLWTVRNDAMELPRSFVLAAACALAAWILSRLHAPRSAQDQVIDAGGATAR